MDDGARVGDKVGLEGLKVGAFVGFMVGTIDGAADGNKDGLLDGSYATVGCAVSPDNVGLNVVGIELG
jgi:hypothetical protein